MPMKISTYNVRGIRKTHPLNNPSHHLTWIRNISPDILALQEVQLPSPPPPADTTRLNQILGAHDAIWTQHCALLLRDTTLSLSDSSTHLDGRVIIATVSS